MRPATSVTSCDHLLDRSQSLFYFVPGILTVTVEVHLSSDLLPDHHQLDHLLDRSQPLFYFVPKFLTLTVVVQLCTDLLPVKLARLTTPSKNHPEQS